MGEGLGPVANPGVGAVVGGVGVGTGVGLGVIKGVGGGVGGMGVGGGVWGTGVGTGVGLSVGRGVGGGVSGSVLDVSDPVVITIAAFVRVVVTSLTDDVVPGAVVVSGAGGVVIDSCFEETCIVEVVGHILPKHASVTMHSHCLFPSRHVHITESN